ncbi:unnamed protein product [Phaedon cochleariae]|uniref:F-box/LRR-repeat protein 15-like leucin rich repeat domain-containing protein n=1 Tax=Phaedon cochleariae TaxID=80249 RepID=A0A9P0GVG1_PHACE|nr:unnamed protein product [Phaedon cochleariae]
MNGLNSVNKEHWRSSVGSLLSIVIDYVVNNLASFSNDNMESLKILPYHIKNRILRKFTTSSYFWKNIDMKQVLSAIVNDNTYHVNLTSIAIDNEILNILTNSKNIQKLYLSRNGNNFITSTGLINLFKHTNSLCLLLLAHCDQMNDDVLEVLANYCPNLMGLDIGGCVNITDMGMDKLSKLRNLTWLTLSSTQISDGGIQSIVTGPSGAKIKELRIEDCKNVTEQGLRAVADNCPKVEILMFHKCSTINSSNIMFQEQPFKNLKHVTWTFTW